MLNVEECRNVTPGTKERVHFNNAGASLMPRPVIDAIQNHISLEASIGGYEAADQVAKVTQGFYESTAELLNCKSTNIAFTSSATSSYARALSCIPFEKGDAVIIANEDYVSNQLAFLSIQKRWGIKLIRVASRPSGGVDIEDIERQMDAVRPRLVSLTHVPTNSGLVQPVEEVGKLCRERNIPYLVDACQSVGQLPVDVQKIQCDFLSVNLRKFLRGPRGAGFLYVSDAVLEKQWEPLFIDTRGANWTDKDQYTLRPDARRFEEWELPLALVLGSKAAIDYALQIGMEQIEARNKVICDRIRQGINALGFQLLDQGEKLCSIITMRIPNADSTTVLEDLRKQRINTSISSYDAAVIDFEKKGVAWALRVSPHYYNSEEEVDVLLAALARLR